MVITPLVVEQHCVVYKPGNLAKLLLPMAVPKWPADSRTSWYRFDIGGGSIAKHNTDTGAQHIVLLLISNSESKWDGITDSLGHTGWG